MTDKIPFWKRVYPSREFGFYDYNPSLRAILLWVVIFLIIGALVAHFFPSEDLTPLTVNL